MLTKLRILIALSLLILTTSVFAQDVPQANITSISIYDFGDVQVHAYTGGPAGNGTYIIESANSLVLIDAQFVAPVAQDFRAYADALGKPIERIVITHEHPDHWFGLGAAFSDVPVYANADVKAILDETGEATLAARGESLGAAPNYVPVENVLPEDGEIIDDVTYEYMNFTGAEAEAQVVILLPDYGIMFVGDLVYNEYYLIVNPDFDAWIAVLEELQSLDGYAYVMPGHGLPADTSVLADNITYIETARDLYATSENGEEFQSAMLELYPDYGGAFFWDIILGILYPTQ